MEEELTRKWKRLSLTEKEKEGVFLLSPPMTKTQNHGPSYLLVMIVAEKSINKEDFKSTISKVWKCESWIQFYEVGLNKFFIEFNNVQDMQRVVKGRPWSFDR
ncbi:hypothetical protein I3760_03G172100 [Carya illinoinensis]|nr:hypothetical protein I3760_03G172100 [Carya illinoinensis]